MPARHRSRHRLAAAALLAAVTGLPGCGTRRFVTVQSEPPGAVVHLNNEEVGRTPLTVPFTHYGVYDVRLAREGHQPLWTSRRATAPAWEFPPVDLAGELAGGEVGLIWRFELTPDPAPGDTATDDLLEAAERLRRRTVRGD